MDDKCLACLRCRKCCFCVSLKLGSYVVGLLWIAAWGASLVCSAVANHDVVWIAFMSLAVLLNVLLLIDVWRGCAPVLAAWLAVTASEVAVLAVAAFVSVVQGATDAGSLAVAAGISAWATYSCLIVRAYLVSLRSGGEAIVDDQDDKTFA